jgi:hypothetical protein
VPRQSSREFSRRASAYWLELRDRDHGLVPPTLDEWCAAGGPESNGSSSSPDTIYGIRIGRTSRAWADLRYPANLHDYRYHVGGDWVAKANADVEFYQGLCRCVGETWWCRGPLRALALARCGIYYMAVSSRLAASHFN